MKQIERGFWETLKRFLEPYGKYKMVTLRATIYYGLWAIGPIVHIYFIQKLVGLIESGNKESFLLILYYYAGYIILFELISYSVKKWGWVETVNNYRKNIHEYYVKKFVSLNNTEVEKMGTGKLISLIGTGMDIWALFLDSIFENVLKIIFTLLYLFYLIFSFNIVYGIIFIILYIIIHIIGEYYNKKTIFHRRKRQDTWNIYTGQLVKILMSKYEILQTSSINKELSKLNNITDRLGYYNLDMASPVHFFYSIPKVFMTIIKYTALGYIGLKVISGEVNIELFVGLFGILTLMDSVIANSMQFYSDLTRNFTKIEKMWDFYDTTPTIKGYNKGKTFIHNKGDINIKNLSYGYTKKLKIFDDFNLKIKGENVTALVGLSGSGKSTLVKLISGYIKSDSGDIIIDKQKLSEISLKSYYKDIGYLTQEPSVFDGTILENLTYAIKGEVNEKELNKIIKLAKCEFIFELPEGVNTEIGEKGIRLSGGQRQRLAIAKIFLKNPKIIILDEPTSALDSFSEEMITKAMNNLFKGRTVIVIAHRLQTVKHANDIILLEKGKIIERGSHKELIKQKGIYNKMLELQSGF